MYIVVITADVYIVNWFCLYPWGWLVLEMANCVNWVPGVHDKVPQIIGGAMPLLNPRLNTTLQLNPKHLNWSIIHCQIRIKKQMLWMTFSLIYSMANRQCQLWAGIFVVDSALKLKTTHANRRYLYARECCRCSVVLMLGHRRQW